MKEFAHSRILYIHTRICIYIYIYATDTRAHSQTRGVVLPFAPFHRGSSARFGCARLSHRGREEEEKERRRVEGGREKSGRGSRDREEYNPEERDAKRVTLASFQDSAGWDTYICQSSREGNASPTFTGASSSERCLCAVRPAFLPARGFLFFEPIFQHL